MTDHQAEPAGAPPKKPEPPILVLANTAAWRAWLDSNEDTHDGVWLLMAKKGVTTPTSLSYADALQEALCSGWIDGQRNSVDRTTFRQRFTPRRARSLWSERNVGYVTELISQGRMRPRGQREIDLAMADGRWDRAYPGPANMTVPDDLAAALAALPLAAERFAALSSQDRFILLGSLFTAASEATRSRRLAKALANLSAQ